VISKSFAAPACKAALAAVILSASASYGAVAQTVSLPPADEQFDYQLGGPYTPARNVGIVVRDRTAAPALGKYNICYVNAFQSQPGDAKWWTAAHPDLLVAVNGKMLVDQDWPGEYLFDTSTAEKRTALMAIVGPWIDACASDGFKAVEADNLDTWTRSRSILTQDSNIEFAKLLVERSHRAGLAIGQKNASEIAPRGKEIGFDFAVAEECHIWSECEAYMAAYGPRVYEVEYSDSQKDGKDNAIKAIDSYNAACKRRGSRISIIFRDRGVVPEGTPGYQYRAC
jgi:hypothetical protein